MVDLCWRGGGRVTGPRIANTAAVVTQIQSLSQLVTVKYVFKKVVIR
jgi:hypothetical protein